MLSTDEKLSMPLESIIGEETRRNASLKTGPSFPQGGSRFGSSLVASGVATRRAARRVVPYERLRSTAKVASYNGGFEGGGAFYGGSGGGYVDMMDMEDMVLESAAGSNTAPGAAGGAGGAVSQNRRVYVGNLSWATAWQGLKDHMKQAGEVTRADVLTDAQGRSKGCGLVEFKTAAQARHAIITLNNTDLDGRQIFLREDREAHLGGDASGPAGGSGQGTARLDPARQQQRVYVGNLSWNVDREQLRQHMLDAGSVVFADVLTEPSGRSKGCGIVEYCTQEEASRAIERLHNTTLNGRPIFVREDRESGLPSGGGGGGAGGPHHPAGLGGHTMMAPALHQYHHPMHHQHPAAHSMHMGGGFMPRGLRAAFPGPRGAFAARMPAPGAVGTRVYVGNLSYEVAWQDLKDHMRRVGNVIHADVLEDHEGRSKGCGVVEYDNPHAAVRAIRELNNTDLKGRLIFVREDREDKKMTVARPIAGAGYGSTSAASAGSARPPSALGRQLFATNLDFDVTWQDLKDHFKGFETQRAEVSYDSEGRSKGFGTVRFATPAEATRALEVMNGSQLHGRAIELREDSRVV